MDASESFEDHMREMAKQLSPEAKRVVMKALKREHEKRFGDRTDIPNDLAAEALKLAKKAN